LSAAIRLGVERVALTARHGVYPEERARDRRFEVDVTVIGDWRAAVESDALRETMDYDAIVRCIHRVSQRQSFHLIESLAGAIADEVLGDFAAVRAVRVGVRKLGLEAWGQGACATAVVTRRQARAEA
jgi:dihydroneopterin aldolase